MCIGCNQRAKDFRLNEIKENAMRQLVVILEEDLAD